jgi:hypothetical protein
MILLKGKYMPARICIRLCLTVLALAALAFCNTIFAASPAGKVKTPELIKLIRTGNIKKVDRMLQNNADVNVRDEQGWTPLMYAIFQKNASLINNLLLHKADVNTQDKDGITPLLAVLDSLSMQPRDITAAQGLPDFIRTVALQLLHAGADPNLADNTGKTPLFRAMKMTAITDPVIQELLAMGADPNRADIDGKTPLMIAVASWESGFVDKLLKAGANPNQMDKEGRTPLYFTNTPNARFTEWAPAGVIQTCSDPLQLPPDLAAGVTQKMQDDWYRGIAPIKKLLVDAGAVDSGTKTGSTSNRPTEAAPQLINRMQLIIDGWLMMRVFVDANGKVKDAVVMVGEENLRDLAFNLKYSPGMKNGQPAECWTVFSGGGKVQFWPK